MYIVPYLDKKLILRYTTKSEFLRVSYNGYYISLPS